MARRFLTGIPFLAVYLGLAAILLRDGDYAAFALLLALGITIALPLVSLQRRERRLGALLEESEARYRLVAESTADLVVRTDRDGFIRYASPAAHRLSGHQGAELSGRHLSDLVHPASAATLTAAHDATVSGLAGQTLELLAAGSQDGDHWLEVDLRRLPGEKHEIPGVIGVLRDIDRRKALEEQLAADRRAFEEQLFAASLTDPLTHLTNRHAFISMLQYLVDMRMDGCLALFDIDYFKSINLQHGHGVGDRILITFTDLVRMLVRSDDIVSRIGGGRFGVLLPRASADQAEAVCQRIIATMSEASLAANGEALHITVSAGVSRIGATLDETMRSAELALVIAKAKGRDRLELSTHPRLAWAPAPQHS